VIDFDDILQKYSKVSRIQFACLLFHVGLLFIKFLSFMFGSAESKHPRLTNGEINISEEFQPMWSQSTNRQTTCDRKSTLCSKVHCTEKIMWWHSVIITVWWSNICEHLSCPSSSLLCHETPHQPHWHQIQVLPLYKNRYNRHVEKWRTSTLEGSAQNRANYDVT